MEKNWIKKTVSVPLGKEDYIIALMDRLGFKEEERKSTGGHMSEERIQITFGGYDADYHENDYIKTQSGTKGYYFFYSLRCVDGSFYDTDEKFKEYHEKARLKDFEILSFSYPLTP